jgi:hypothetical protein
MNLQDQNGERTAGDRDILLRGRSCVPELILSWGTFQSHESDFFDFSFSLWSMALIVRQFFRKILKASPHQAVGSGAAGP